MCFVIGGNNIYRRNNNKGNKGFGLISVVFCYFDIIKTQDRDVDNIVSVLLTRCNASILSIY